jgi:hypothetical protein
MSLQEPARCAAARLPGGRAVPPTARPFSLKRGEAREVRVGGLLPGIRQARPRCLRGGWGD